MGSQKAISENGPWRGLYSAADTGDVPPGGSPDQSNVVNLPGNPAAFQPRRGIHQQMHEDRLPAPFPAVFPIWATGTVYTANDSGNEDQRVQNSGIVYDLKVSHTAGTFVTDVAAGKWVATSKSVEGAFGKTAGQFVYGYNNTQVITESYGLPSLWVGGGDYIADMIVVYRADDPRAADGHGGAVWRSTGTNTATGSFFDDVNAGEWTLLTTPEGSLGIVTSSPGSVGGADNGPFYQVLSSDGTTIAMGTFGARRLFSLPPGYDPQSSTVPNPFGNEVPSWAFFGSFSESTGNSHLTRLDTNAFSSTVGTGNSQALTSGIYHRPWIVKGSDNICYWLAWRSVNNQGTSSSLNSYAGTWDGVTLVEMEFDPEFSEFDEGVFYDNGSEDDRPPTAMGIGNNMDMVLIASAARMGGVEPQSPAKATDPETGDLLENDIAWRFSPDTIRDNLFSSNGKRSDLFLFEETARRSSPQMIGLSNGNFLLFSMDSTGSGRTGINVRQIAWTGEFPLVAKGSIQAYTTSDGVPFVDHDPDGPRNHFAGSGKICLVDDETYAVSRGTDGFSICPISGGVPVNVSAGFTDIRGVCGDTRSNRIYAADAVVGVAVIVRRHTKNGSIAGTPWTTSDYAALSGSFRGMFMDRRQLFLCVMTYDDNEAAGDRNRLTCIPVGVDDWVTTTVQAYGDVVVESNRVYQCIEAHTAGTFATDLSNNLWGLNGNTSDALTISFVMNMTTLGVPAANEEFFWAFNDSSASQLINMAQVVQS